MPVLLELLRGQSFVTARLTITCSAFEAIEKKVNVTFRMPGLLVQAAVPAGPPTL